MLERVATEAAAPPADAMVADAWSRTALKEQPQMTSLRRRTPADIGAPATTPWRSVRAESPARGCAAETRLNAHGGSSPLTARPDETCNEEEQLSDAGAYPVMRKPLK